MKPEVTGKNGKPLKERSLVSIAKFTAALDKAGATLLEPHWLGSSAKHHVRCAAGHDCWPYASHTIKGVGVCRICAGRSPEDAERRFRLRVAELGGSVVGPYLDTGTPVAAQCGSGHLGNIYPGHVLKGIGICRECAGNGPATGEAKFRVRVAELGGLVLGDYRGARVKIRVACNNGHECTVVPHSIVQGVGLCGTCAGNTKESGAESFREQVVNLGATQLGRYINNRTPVHVRCAAGHDCWPEPSSVGRGQGVCRICAGKVWDAFYVVHNPATATLKFGITSGNPRARLGDHARNGFTSVLRLHTGLDNNVPVDLERELIANMRMAGVRPVQGREYFPDATLNVVLALVDGWLS